MTESGMGCSGDCNEQHAKHYDDDAEDSKHRGGNEHIRDNKSTNGRINVGSPDNATLIAQSNWLLKIAPCGVTM